MTPEADLVFVRDGKPDALALAQVFMGGDVIEAEWAGDDFRAINCRMAPASDCVEITLTRVQFGER